jgi:ABC-type antimicrobial peptide transport system permease subunit
MRRLIAKGLRGGAVRFAICIGGIAVSTMLVLVLFGAYRSVSSAVIQFARRSRADLWIAPRGTDNLIRSSGFLDLATIEQIRRMRGVSRIDPILRAFVTAESRGKRLTLLAVRFRAPRGLGGPAVLLTGAMPTGPAEVALDRAAAHMLSVQLHDTLSMNGTDVRVAGITSGTNLLATQFVFGDFDSSARQLTTSASFGLVEVAGGVTSEALRADIHERFPALEVMGREAFITNNLRETGSGFLPMLLLISILGMSSSALLIAFLIEGVVEQRRGELAVLLATGATPLAIAAGLGIHAAKLLVSGIVIGAAGAHLLAATIDFFAPVIPLSYSVTDMCMVAVLLALSGIIAALLPLYRLKDIDPLEAFRS